MSIASIGAMTPWDVFGKIARGDVFYYELRVPEGSNIFDIAAAVEKLGMIKRDDFLKVARDPSLIRDLAPEAPTLEGYLFPSTYHLVRQTTTAATCPGNDESVPESVEGRSEAPSADVNRLVTLASLVEKETAVPGRTAEVASGLYQPSGARHEARLRSDDHIRCDARRPLSGNHLSV